MRSEMVVYSTAVVVVVDVMRRLSDGDGVGARLTVMIEVATCEDGVDGGVAWCAKMARWCGCKGVAAVGCIFPLKDPCPQGSRCGTCRGCGFCEEVWILLPKLIFTFPCELKTSSTVPSNFDDGDTALI
ncbi:hypothetical protein Tco_0016152 [Tanacetum coccineum]